MILQKTKTSAKIPKLIMKILPQLIWNIPNNDNKIFLTFDDGPIPHVTEWILDVLSEYDAKATFFCVGENIKKHPHIYQRILTEGHATGCHTYNHLNGWKTDNKTYIHNIEKAENFVQSNLFRPPHGKLKLMAMSKLLKKYHIIMWDVLTQDYDQLLTGDDIYQNVVNNVESGSIIVFHDSLKSVNNLKTALPQSIEYLKNQGFILDKIDFPSKYS